MVAAARPWLSLPPARKEPAAQRGQGAEAGRALRGSQELAAEQREKIQVPAPWKATLAAPTPEGTARQPPPTALRRQEHDAQPRELLQQRFALGFVSSTAETEQQPLLLNDFLVTKSSPNNTEMKSVFGNYDFWVHLPENDGVKDLHTE